MKKIINLLVEHNSFLIEGNEIQQLTKELLKLLPEGTFHPYSVPLTLTKENAFVFTNVWTKLNTLGPAEQAEFICAFNDNDTWTESSNTALKNMYAMIKKPRPELQRILIQKLSWKSVFVLSISTVATGKLLVDKYGLICPEIIESTNTMPIIPDIQRELVSKFPNTVINDLYGVVGLYTKSKYAVPDQKALNMLIKVMLDSGNKYEADELKRRWKLVLTGKVRADYMDLGKLTIDQMIALVQKDGMKIQELYNNLDPGKRMPKEVIIAALEQNLQAMEVIPDEDLNDEAIKFIIQDIKHSKGL